MNTALVPTHGRKRAKNTETNIFGCGFGKLWWLVKKWIQGLKGCSGNHSGLCVNCVKIDWIYISRWEWGALVWRVFGGMESELGKSGVFLGKVLCWRGSVLGGNGYIGKETFVSFYILFLFFYDLLFIFLMINFLLVTRKCFIFYFQKRGQKCSWTCLDKIVSHCNSWVIIYFFRCDILYSHIIMDHNN